MDSELLDQGINFQLSSEKLRASEEQIRNAIIWAWLGGIGGIILGGKMAYGSHFVAGKVDYLYDELSREAGKRAQRIGLFIWIPIYILFIAAYLSFILSLGSFL